MNTVRILLIFVISALALSACGTTSRTSTKKSADNVLETGVASWYGPKFHGRLTANGERYDMDGITAAHRTLPFNTVVLVENLDNGKTVEVRINDRGPFAKNRIIDLSRGAARKVDMIGPGTARVRLYLIEGDLENSRTTDLKQANYTIQLGSYKNRGEAEKKSKKIKGSRVESIWLGTDRWYRVYYGNYKDPLQAKNELKKFQEKGYEAFVKQIEND